MMASDPPMTARSAPQVSALIPTRNAGPGFGDVLRALRGQKGLDGLEILVADSGSTDGTPELAAANGAGVIEIDPEEFNHGRVRNVLAERARGEILLLTVQDAVLAGRRAARNLADILAGESTLAAVSALQVAGSGADPYARFHVWSYGRDLAAAGILERPWHRRFRDRGEPDPNPVLESLRGATVDNVCAAIPRAVWEKFPFAEREFAEDLDFGVRARSAGHRARFTSRAVVGHHHNREAAYVFARSAIGGEAILELVPDAPMPPLADGVDALAGRLRSMIGELEAALTLAEESEAEGLVAFSAEVGRGLRAGLPPAPPTGELAVLNALLGGGAGPAAADESLRAKVIAVCEWQLLRQFTREDGGGLTAADARRFIGRLVASVLGWECARGILNEAEHPLAVGIHRRVRSQHDE
jgi:rhamnosyltransferase